jgi:hypothetical protein
MVADGGMRFSTYRCCDFNYDDRNGIKMPNESDGVILL